MKTKNTSNINLLTGPDDKYLPYFQAVILIYAILLTVPMLFLDSYGGFGSLDMSWSIGLHKAADAGLIFGKDIVFTYGPLGFLTVPIFVKGNLWAYSAIYTLAVYALMIFGFLLYIRKTKASLEQTVILAVSYIAASRGLVAGRDLELMLSIFIFSYLYILGPKKLPLLLGLSFLYSVLPFIKFSSVVAGGIIGVAFLYFLIQDKRNKEALTFAISCLILLSGIGLILFKSPKAFFIYLYGCWQISDGYNNVMQYNGSMIDIGLAISAWALYIILLRYCISKKNRDGLIFLALGFGLLFLGFKLGFVRQDDHIIYFYSIWTLIFGLYYLKSFADAKITKYIILSFIFIMLYQCGSEMPSSPNRYLRNSFKDRLENLRVSFNLLRGVGELEQTTIMKKQLSNLYRLKPETLITISNHTMDVFPYDISITEAYNFNWHPRPIFQSYSAYTEYLDSLNAKHFSSDSAPEYILYALGTIDLRYAIFDEPKTFRTLLQKYKPCGQDGKFLVLRKNPSAPKYIEEYAGEKTVKFRETIPIPQVGNTPLFARIYVERNLLGIGRAFLFKPPIINFVLLNGQNIIGDRVWRFVAPNAMNGLFVSKCISDQNSLLEIWRGDIQQDITSMVLFTEHPAFFKNKIKVAFFKMKLENN
jgi:hypothetical protein